MKVFIYTAELATIAKCGAALESEIECHHKQWSEPYFIGEKK
jgi:hypothetical protein